MNLTPASNTTMKNRSLALQHVMLSLLIGSSVALLSACSEKPTSPTATSKPAAAPDPMEVTIKPEMRAQFELGQAQEVNITPWLEVAGRIEANEQLVTRIGASVTGRVTQVLAEVGDRVRTGQTLARISSPELTNMQLNYLRAYSTAAQAQRALERAQLLIQADVIGTAELQRRESELVVARAEMRAASDQLVQAGLPVDAIERLREQGNLHPSAAISATLTGVVIERKVSTGQVAQPGDPLFTVANLDNVWVVGALPEQIARSALAGQKVDIQVPALGDRVLSGKIVYVGDTVSVDTRSVMIRTQVENARRDLKPQMLATMRIRGEAQTALAIPAKAVVRENDRDHVFVRKSELVFQLTPVELGPANGDHRPVLKGLSLGTQLVTQGAFHLNNERKRAELE
jgi:cobalt-zinc-cadmium efflux system membrane fusion protein